MKNKQLIIRSMLVFAAFLLVLISCDKDEKEEVDYSSTQITANEPKTIIKFKIPDGETTNQIVLTGTLREYEEADVETGAVEVISFEITGTIKGNYKDGNTAAMTPGDPLPGMDITVEQSPPTTPSSSFTTNSDGVFTINIDNPSAGLYTIIVNGESSKVGFVISDFDAN